MNNQNKKLSAAIGLAVALAHPVGALAAEAEQVAHSEDDIEEIVVTAPFQQTEAETALPVGILSGEALREKVGNSLGDTLKNEVGVANASFGVGVGQPVIRGQSGNRVNILQNGVGTTDASRVSPDHANAVDALLAERLEVIRGPSALLYGSGAVGGVVNVIDNRIPESLPDEPRFVFQQSHSTVNAQNQTLLRLDGAAGNIAFHLDAFTRKSDNAEISGYAIDEEAIEALEELVEQHLEEAGHHEEDELHAEEEHHEEEGIENTFGFIGNSDMESDGGTVGFSLVGDDSFIGFSVSELRNNYGLPPGVHLHAHEEEDHGDEEEEQDHEEEVEFVRVDMGKTRYDLKGELRLTDSWIRSIRVSAGFSDYEHGEIEVFEDGGSEVGTLYENSGAEARMTMTHVPVGNWNGVWGLQFLDTAFSALGEEAFIPKADISAVGLFGVERYTSVNWTGEVGVRRERNGVDPSGACEFSTNNTSISGSILYEVGGDANLLFGASRSQRAPSVEELFSNVSAQTCGRHADDESLVLHAATSLLEIGNPLLEKEISNNLEFGYRKFGGGFTGELSAYINQIDNFIYLDLTSEEFEGQQIAAYLARDARFTGIEGEVSFDIFESGDSVLALGVFGDLVNAEFDAGGYLPRIPPAKLGAELRFFGEDWSFHLHATRVYGQNDVAELELATGGYTVLSLSADYHWEVGEHSSLEVFLRGDNLLDEEIRNHVSFLKNYSPEPGRGVMLGVRFEY